MSQRTAILLGIFLMCSALAVPAPPEVKSTELDGTVIDMNGARLPKADIDAVSIRGEKYVTQTTDDGTYAFLVPPGVYRIRASRSGFCEARRAAVALTGQATLKFNFQLFICPYLDVKPSDDSTYVPMADPTPRYHVEEVGPVIPNGLRPLISYGKRESEGNSIHYSSLVIDSRQFPVIYTYDLITVTADNLVYSTMDSSLRGAGHVVWQDAAGITQYASAIEISFESYKPRIKIEK